MKINEIFYSLQGEGARVGIPSVFVRFSGCNLACGFCDTNHQRATEMSVEEIVNEVNAYPTRNVVLTGGEPTLQLSVELLSALKSAGKFIQIETNGTCDLADDLLDMIDWVTCSPKNMAVKLHRINEVKALFTGHDGLVDYAEQLARSHGAQAMLQPCDVGDVARNRAIVAATIDYIKQHLMWRLSLQTHKLLNIR
jgi:organic radical activating enzyme